MVEIIVFSGPTLAAESPGIENGGISVLGPAAQGDIFRASQNSPFAIVLIDGYFDSVPAPWHRELLWAMSAGIYVFGAGSIGALRAAELTELGMMGVGEIYRMFADGRLTDDDEVAVVHGPEELGFPLLSIAMVDIRATLCRAKKIVSVDVAEKITAVAKGLNFRDRSLQRICDSAVDAGVPADAISKLQAWWPDNFISQKHRDAVEAVHAARAWRDQDPGMFDASFLFQVTDAWVQFVESQKDQIGSMSNPLRL